MRDVELPAERDDSDLIITQDADEGVGWSDEERASVERQRASAAQPATVTMDEGAEPESDADALDAQAPKRGI
jgi:hypothetical protein